MFRDYRCVVLEDCTAEPIGATLPRTNHEASLLNVEMLFGWVSDAEKFIDALAGGIAVRQGEPSTG
jgi:ureidoacrylate peracid hydrolase